MQLQQKINYAGGKIRSHELATCVDMLKADAIKESY